MGDILVQTQEKNMLEGNMVKITTYKLLAGTVSEPKHRVLMAEIVIFYNAA